MPSGRRRSPIPKASTAAMARRAFRSSRAVSASRARCPQPRATPRSTSSSSSTCSASASMRARRRSGCGTPMASGVAACRPDEQPVHGHRRVPQRHRLLGPERHGVPAQPADPLDTVRRTDSARSRSRIENRATTSNRADPRSGPRARRAIQGDEEVPDLTAQCAHQRATGATCRSPAFCAMLGYDTTAPPATNQRAARPAGAST